MADKKNHADHLETVMNQLADSVLGLSDEAVLAESDESGVDPNQAAERTRLVLRDAAKVLEDANTLLSNLGHTINATSWRRGQIGFHNRCLSCGSSVTVTTAAGEMQGKALDESCPDNAHCFIPRRRASRK